MKTIIAGKNEIAINITDWLLKTYPDITIYVVFNKNETGIDGHQRSFKKYCLLKGVTDISLEDAYVIENSIFLSLEFDQIVKPKKFKHDNIYNMHFSLLPKYKGMYTSAWPILNKEKKSGVTLHEIDEGIDTGAIIDQFEFPLEEAETAKTLYKKYIKFGTDLVIENLPSLLNNNYKSIAQKAIDGSYYSKKSIDYANLKIDLNKAAYEILHQINAFTFRDYQLPEVFGYQIFGGQILNKRSSKKPGQLLADLSHKIVISTIDFDVELNKDCFQDLLAICYKGTPQEIINLSCSKQILLEKMKKAGVQ